MEVAFLEDAVTILLISAVALVICQKTKVNSIIGFLAAGIIAGPHELALISPEHHHSVEQLAELGIVMLLFTIGIEFSFKKLVHIKKLVLAGGFGQTLLTIGLTFAAGLAFGVPWNQALFFGFLVALSSTAIVLKYLQEKLEVDTPHGKASLGILIFQDMFVILMILLTPLLAGGGAEGEAVFLPVLKAIALIVLTLFISIQVVPRLLKKIISYRSNELFLLTIILICLAIAQLTSMWGLSLGIGAFLAGLAISESDYHDQALQLVIPFRDVFLSFFFVSVGMLLDIGYVLETWQWVLVGLVSVIALKILIVWAVTYFLKLPLRNCLLAGMFLFQVGEFSFILAKQGLVHNLLDHDSYQLFLAISILSMALTPIFITVAHWIVDSVKAQTWFNKLDRHAGESINQDLGENCNLKDHLIIIGYGLNGRWLSAVCTLLGRKYIIIEANPETVKREKANGENMIFGDASNSLIWEKACIDQARAVVIAISDPKIIPTIVQNIRRMNEQIHIIVRTRFISEHEDLEQLGVDDLVSKDFESTLEVVKRAMSIMEIDAEAQIKMLHMIKEQVTPSVPVETIIESK